MHQVLERYARGELVIFELASEYQKIYPQIVKEDFPYNKYKNLQESYYQQGLDYFNNFAGFDEYKILGVEKEVTFDVGEYKFGGFIDLVVEDKDENIVIIDHKSKSKLSGTEKEKYLKQMYLYSNPIIKEYGKTPKYLKFNMVRFNDWVTEDFGMEKFIHTDEWACRTIQNIYETSKFAPTQSSYYCSFICSARETCEYHRR